MTAATEAEIKQWIIREFRMMDAETVITGITLERYPLRIPNWRILRASCDSDLLMRFLREGQIKLENGLYLVDKKP